MGGGGGGPLLMRRLEGEATRQRLETHNKNDMIQAYKDFCEQDDACWGVQIFEHRYIGNQIGLCINRDAQKQDLHPNSGFQNSRLFQRTVVGRPWNEAGWGQEELSLLNTQDSTY